MDGTLKTCGPCSKDSELGIPAMCLCYDCQEFLCEECRKFHGRSKASANHKVVDVDSISLDGSIITRVNHMEWCLNHPGKSVEFVCKDHDVLCCSLCAVADHRKCEHVLLILEQAKDVRLGQNHVKLNTDINEFSNCTATVISRELERLHTLDKDMNGVTVKLANFKTKVQETVSAIEKNIMEDAERKYKFQKENLSKHLAEVRDVEAVLNDSKKVLENTAKRGSDSKLFIIIHVLTKHISELSKAFRGMNEPSYQSLLAVELSAANSFLADLKALLSPQSDRVTIGPDIPHLSSTPRTGRSLTKGDRKQDIRKAPNLIATFNMQSPSDIKPSSISSITTLKDSRIVVVDENNCCIKVFSESFDLMMDKKFDSVPFDIAETDNNEVAVSFPQKRRISLMLIDKYVRERRVLQRLMPCYGLVKAGRNKLAVMNYTRRTFHTLTLVIINFGGKELVEVEVDSAINVDKPFRSMTLAANTETGNLYLPLFRHNQVLVLDNQGTVLRRLSNEQLQNPTGVALDLDGNCLVVGLKSRDVHQFSSNGLHDGVLLSTVNGLHNPLCICVDKKRGLVMVSNDGSPQEMKVFRLG